MGRLIKETLQSIHIRLLTMINADLRVSFKDIEGYVEKLQEMERKNDEGSLLILKLKSYIDSSETVLDNLKDWSECQLLYGKWYSSNLRFQTEVIIQIIKSISNKNVIVKNNVQDLKGVKADLALFGFALSKLLSFIMKFCTTDEVLEIGSVNYNNEVIISLSTNKRTPFNNLGKICLNNNLNEELIQPDKDQTLTVCYDVLSFYGGNLWSESSDCSGLKIYFSMQANKNL